MPGALKNPSLVITTRDGYHSALPPYFLKKLLPSDTLQRTNIRVSYNVEPTSVLILIQPCTSGMIFIFPILLISTIHQLSRRIYEKLLFPFQGFCFRS